MKIIQTYQQGGRHKTANQPCEDRTYSMCENGVQVISLADGAGSSKYTHSAQGAECVTEAIASFFCNNFDKFYEKDSSEELSAVVKMVCQRALQKKVEEIGLDGISRLSSTLLCLAVKENKVICCHIGDGVIGKLNKEGTVVVSAPDNGEFAGTTYFVTNPKAEQHIRVIKEEVNDTIAYFLMSDGTSDFIYNKSQNSFYDAAKKMALMPFEKDGQQNLENTVSEYMVNRESKSDDCSFICISLADSIESVSPLIEKPKGKSVSKAKKKNKAKNKAEKSNEKKLPVEENEEIKPVIAKQSESTQSKKMSSKKVIAASLIALILIGCATGISIKIKKKKLVEQDSNIDSVLTLSEENNETTAEETISNEEESDNKQKESSTKKEEAVNKEKESSTKPKESTTKAKETTTKAKESTTKAKETTTKVTTTKKN